MLTQRGAQGAHTQRELQALIEVAGTDRSVEGARRDFAIARIDEYRAHAALVGEREWPWCRRVGGCDRRQKRQRCLQRKLHPGVVLQRPPANEAETAARPHAAPDVAERRGRITEE